MKDLPISHFIQSIHFDIASVLMMHYKNILQYTPILIIPICLQFC